MPRYSLPLTAACALLLSACGGGGGGGGGGGSGSGSGGSGYAGSVAATPAPATQRSEITAEIAGQAARIGRMASQGDAPMALGMLDLLEIDKNLRAGTVGTQSCAGSGTMSITGQPTGLTKGATVTVVYRDCFPGGQGQIKNGTVRLAVSDASGAVLSTANGALKLAVRYDTLTLRSAAGNEHTVSGDTFVAASTVNWTTTIDVTAATLQASSKPAGAPAITYTLSNYAGTIQIGALWYTSSAEVQVSGSGSGLSPFNYSVHTVQPFRNTGAAGPDTGSLVVSGASSSVTVTALDLGNARLDFRAKADGPVTQSATMLWTGIVAGA